MVYQILGKNDPYAYSSSVSSSWSVVGMAHILYPDIVFLLTVPGKEDIVCLLFYLQIHYANAWNSYGI